MTSQFTVTGLLAIISFSIVLVVGFAAVNAFAAGFFPAASGQAASLSGLLFEVLGSLAVGASVVLAGGIWLWILL